MIGSAAEDRRKYCKSKMPTRRRHKKKDRIMAKLRRGFRVRVPVQLFYSRFLKAIQPRAPIYIVLLHIIFGTVVTTTAAEKSS